MVEYSFSPLGNSPPLLKEIRSSNPRRATAVLYIPIDQLLSSTPSTVGPVLLDLSHPILDLSIESSTTFWVSLDLSRGPPSSEGLCSVRRVELKDGKLVEMESGEFEKLVSSSAALCKPSPADQPHSTNSP